MTFGILIQQGPPGTPGPSGIPGPAGDQVSPQAQSCNDLHYISTQISVVCVYSVIMCRVDVFVYVFSQGFTGKQGMEGPQGPVGMYVSDL